MKRLLPLIFILCLATGTALKAQNEFPALSNNPIAKPANLAKQGIHKPITHAAHNPYKAKYDSIYKWLWDTTTVNWSDNQAYQKYVNIIYDAHNNMLTQTWQVWSGSAWVNEELWTYTYDANNNILSETTENWSGSAWVNYSLDTYSYNANNSILTETDQTWSGSAWVNYSLDTYIYDAHNNELSFTYQSWSGSAWTNEELYTYTYDAHNNLLTLLEQQWGGGWNKIRLYTCTYDANNNMLTNIYQTWSSYIWVNFLKSIYTYDAHNNQLTQTDQAWTGSAWVNNDLWTYTYDANNNKLTATYQTWTGSAWGNNDLSIYTYDANNNTLTELDQNWNGSAWFNIAQYRYTYDANNVELSNRLVEFNASDTKVRYGDSTHYYLTDVLGINNLSEQVSNISVYPNPSKGIFTIQWSAISDKSSVEIYNVLGEQVKRFELTGSTNQVDLSSQPNGFYLYRVISEEGNLIGQGKLIIQK